MKPICPNLRQRGGYCPEADEYLYDEICDLVDKHCLVAYEQQCDTYDEFVKEQKHEDLD